MKRFAILFVLVGCSSPAVSGTFEPPVDAGTDAEPADSGPTTCAFAGPTACTGVVATLCNRYVQCSTTGLTVAACKGYVFNQGIDCASAKFVNTKVTCSTVSKCNQTIPSISCADIASNKANWPADCLWVSQ